MLNYQKTLFIYLLTLAIFLAVDAVWLGFIASSLYQSYLAAFLGGGTNLLAAAIFYLLFPVGIVHFAVRRPLLEGSPASAFTSGALFGLFAYATYDLTNWATLPGWPAFIVAVDIAWGTILTGTTAAAAVWLAHKWILKP